MATIRGGEKLEAHLTELSAKVSKAASVKVGFLANAKTYPGGMLVAAVAAIQNFGAPRAGIPPRPFFSNMVEAKKGEWGHATALALEASDMDSARALAIVGTGIKGQLQMSIRDFESPALSPVTLLLRKRFWSNPEDIRARDVAKARADVAAGADYSGVSTKPLEWTKNMLQSVDYEVTE